MKRVVIAGCRGRMGAMLMQRFARAQDIQPAGLSRPYRARDVEDACRGARAVILCVPPEALAETAGKLVPHMEPGTILADITSVKELPMRQMEAAWTGPVVGTHPLFGPLPKGWNCAPPSCPAARLRTQTWGSSRTFSGSWAA